MIILMILPLKTGLCFNGWSFLFMFLNGAVFSTIGVVVSFYAKNHADVPRFSNYVIMPMSYLCNTFFSAQNMPDGIRQLVSYLPLSQTSAALRQIANHEAFSFSGILILILYLASFSAAASWFLYKKKNL